MVTTTTVVGDLQEVLLPPLLQSSGRKSKAGGVVADANATDDSEESPSESAEPVAVSRQPTHARLPCKPPQPRARPNHINLTTPALTDGGA